jgi:hypothetical protein
LFRELRLYTTYNSRCGRTRARSSLLLSTTSGFCSARADYITVVHQEQFS